MAVMTVREGKHCLAEGLARNRALGKAHAPDIAVALDDGHPLAPLGGLNGGALARRATADAEEIEIVFRAHLSALHPWRRWNPPAERADGSPSRD